MNFYDQLRQLQAKSQGVLGDTGGGGAPGGGGGMSPMRPDRPRPMTAPQMQGQSDRMGSLVQEGMGGTPPGKPGDLPEDLKEWLANRPENKMKELKDQLAKLRDQRARARAACMSGNQQGCAYAEKFEQEMADIQEQLNYLTQQTREQEQYQTQQDRRPGEFQRGQYEQRQQASELDRINRRYGQGGE